MTTVHRFRGEDCTTSDPAAGAVAVCGCGSVDSDGVPGAATADIGTRHVGNTRLQRRVSAAIVWYQQVREGRPSPCRFFPSCSSYALEAVTLHGTRRGGWLTVRRLLRCRPLGPSGFDPVPVPRSGPRPDHAEPSPLMKAG